MKKVIIAADLGGTNLRMAAVTADGKILSRSRFSTPSSGTQDDVIEAIRKGADECLSLLNGEYEAVAFGAAVAGVVNWDEGSICHSPNLPFLDGMPFSKMSSNALGVSAVLENDANAAALGEYHFGASRDVRNCVHITLGTGVGGGLIIDGRIHRGVNGTAGEIGHVAVEPDGYPCGCGSRGCLEQYASATAIVRLAKEMIPAYPATVLRSDIELTPLEVYEAGVNGDALANEVFRIVGTYLGIALGGIVNVLNPDAIVFGGGAAAGWDLFIEPLRSELNKRAFPHPAEHVRLMRSVLGDDAGLLGAARLAAGMVVATED